MQARRVLSIVVFGAALALLSGCGSTNPLSTTNSVLDSTPPAAPTNLKAAVDAGSLTLTWDASPDADVAGYDIYRYAPDPSRENSYVKINSSLVTATSYVVADATTQNDYYRVKAVDTSANVSASSSAIDAAGVDVTASQSPTDPEPGVRRARP